MKLTISKILNLSVSMIALIAMMGCADSADVIEDMEISITQDPFKSRASNETLDSLALGDIIPVQDSPYKRINQKTRYSSENNAFFDIREMDVNIMVRENAHSNKRYLSSNGVQKEMALTETNNSNRQNFKLYIMPLTGYIYIKDYEGHMVSMGVYSNAPDTRVLYVKEGESTTGACWDFLKGVQRKYSNILENADALAQGPGGWMDVYNEVLGVKNSKLYFSKYNNSATQEFEIRVVEDLTIVENPQYDFSTMQPEEKPNYVLRGSVTNNSSRPATMTVNYSESANVTSSFQENKSFTTSISGNTGISTPIFSIGGSASSSNTYGFSYTQGSTKNIAASFNQTIEVAPYTSVEVIAVVRNYQLTCNYSMKVEGTKSGRQFIIDGIWKGISCVDVNYTVNEMSTKTGQLIKTFNCKAIPGQKINLIQDAFKSNN